MKMETVKSIILTILVLISIFFTWNIWTYQPDYSEIPNSQYVDNNPLSDVTRKAYDVIAPKQILVHERGNHYGTYDQDLIYKLWQEMRKWELDNFRNVSDSIEKNGFYRWVNGESEDDLFISLIFSDTVPISALAGETDWMEKDTYNIKFDRIMIPYTKDSTEQKLYFVDFDEHYVIQAKVKTTLSKTWNIVYESAKKDFARFVFINESILLPEKSFPMRGELYFTKFLLGDQFKNALFNNPSYVKKDVNGTEYIYTDSYRQLVIIEDQAKVLYVNPTIDQSLTTDKGKLILQSIDFLNAHGGWISGYNDYKYFTTDEEQKVYFRLTINNYPVFAFTDSRYTITSIIQSWGNTEIELYQRPLFYLDDFIRGEETKLPSAKEVLAAIQNDSTLSMDEIKQIFPAYDIQLSSRQDIVYLQPVWGIELSNGRYRMLNTKNLELGGIHDGLE